MQKDTLVHHKNIPAVLAKVVREDENNKSKLVIKCLSNNREFSCPKEDLVRLGD